MAEIINRGESKKTIIRLTGPILLELLLGTLFGMIDIIMLGNFNPKVSGVGVDIAISSIAAVGISNQYIFIGLSLVQAFSMGTTIMLAGYSRERRQDKIDDVIRTSILLIQLCIVFPFVILGLARSREVMSFLGANIELIGVGVGYFRLALVGFLFQSFSFILFASMRGLGQNEIPMKLSVMTNLLNLLGNFILIFGKLGLPELGVLGAGISTAFSQILGFLILVLIILRDKKLLRSKIDNRWSINRDIGVSLGKIGGPVALEQLVLRSGILVFMRLIASLGTISYGVHQICTNILNLSFVPGQALGIVASTFTNRSLVKREPELAEEYIEICKNLGILASLLMMSVFFLFREEISIFYTSNLKASHNIQEILKIMILIQPFQSAQLIMAGGLRGAGDTEWAISATFLGILFIRTVLTYLFIYRLSFGLYGAWIAILVDQIVRWILIKIRFVSGKWKYIK